MREIIKPIVYIVDDDASVRKALQRLIRSAGMNVEVFGSAREFLSSGCRMENTCLLADIQMPEMSGLALQRELCEAGLSLPVIFITAFDCSESREEARKLGAAGFFRKPVDDEALLEAIRQALPSTGPH